MEGRKIDVIAAYRSPSPDISNIKNLVEKDMDDIIQHSKRQNDCVWLADGNVD